MVRLKISGYLLRISREQHWFKIKPITLAWVSNVRRHILFQPYFHTLPLSLPAKHLSSSKSNKILIWFPIRANSNTRLGCTSASQRIYNIWRSCKRDAPQVCRVFPWGNGGDRGGAGGVATSGDICVRPGRHREGAGLVIRVQSSPSLPPPVPPPPPDMRRWRHLLVQNNITVASNTPAKLPYKFHLPYIMASLVFSQRYL